MRNVQFSPNVEGLEAKKLMTVEVIVAYAPVNPMTEPPIIIPPPALPEGGIIEIVPGGDEGFKKMMMDDAQQMMIEGLRDGFNAELMPFQFEEQLQIQQESYWDSWLRALDNIIATATDAQIPLMHP